MNMTAIFQHEGQAGRRIVVAVSNWSSSFSFSASSCAMPDSAGRLSAVDGLPPNWRAPGFRGLDVATNGTVYAAATGCRCVVKITSAGKLSTVLKSDRPWNPTGVALRDGDVYVLEWTNANGGANDGWRPRVRKIARDGTVSLLVEIRDEVRR